MAARIRLGGEAVQAAVTGVIDEIGELGGVGGMIAVSPAGEAAWHFSTRAMYRGRVAAGVAPMVAIYGDEG